MPVGEQLLGAFVEVVLDKLGDAAVMALARRERIASHFEELHKLFSSIRHVLENTEDKQLTMETEEEWLEELRYLAYDLDDILYEITYRGMVQDSKLIKNHNTSVPCPKMIHTSNNFMPGGLVFNYKLSSKIRKITKRLNHITKQRADLNLTENVGWSSSRAGVIMWENTSWVTKSNVYGIDEDKKTIKEMLFKVESSSQNFNVIPIVGMAGVGKTTLAHLLFNDKDMEQNFLARVWVYVSQEFDVLKITKAIYESVTVMSGQNMNLNTLQVRLREKLANNKCFLVLDDVWNENQEKWNTICNPFEFGLLGSKIITTTHNHAVVSVVGSAQSADT